MIGSANALSPPIWQAVTQVHTAVKPKDRRRTWPSGGGRLAAAGTASAMAGCNLGSRRHIKKRSEVIAKAEEQPERQGSTAVISGSQGVLDRLWQNQRQNMNVLVAGIVGAMIFGTYVTLSLGAVAGAKWFACYFIEYSLSVDNLFVFIVIFDYFKVTGERQSQVLNYGVAGAVILRFLFVYMGAQLLQRFDFLILLFSAILGMHHTRGWQSRTTMTTKTTP